MFTLRIRGLVIHYVWESPHKDRITGMCVCWRVSVILLAGQNLWRVHFGWMFLREYWGFPWFFDLRILLVHTLCQCATFIIFNSPHACLCQHVCIFFSFFFFFRAVSTFWIAHPNNNLINNAAAGSQVTRLIKMNNQQAEAPLLSEL